MKTTTFLTLLATTLLSVRAEHAPENGVSEAPLAARLSLTAVTRAVLENNPAIREADNRWRGAQERVRQATAWDDLKVSADSEFKRFVNIPPNAFTDQAVTVEQSIPLTGKNLSRGRIATPEALSVNEDVRRTRLVSLATARSGYFRLDERSR